MLPYPHNYLRVAAGLAVVTILTAYSFTLAADPPTLTIPKLTKPLVEPVADDPLQADYDKMWEDYEAAITKARDGILTAFDKQVSKATDDGDLDQVERWEAVKKTFAADGTLAWDTSSKALAEWKKANPKVPFPRELNDAVRAAVTGAESAKEQLDEGYTSLVRAYTKAKNVARAKDLRAEAAALTVAASVPQQPQKGPQGPPPVKGGPKKPIREGVVVLAGHQYRLFREHADWYAAKKQCEDLGGHMVIIETAQEQDALKRWLAEQNLREVWLGATDSAEEGVWRWVNGRKVTFAAWARGEPNNEGGGEHYAIMDFTRGAPGLWNDGGLGAHPFICEWEE